MREKIEPLVLPRAVAQVEEHRRAGDQLLIVTATNDFVTRPIAKCFGVHVLIATTAELNTTAIPTGSPARPAIARVR